MTAKNTRRVTCVLFICVRTGIYSECAKKFAHYTRVSAVILPSEIVTVRRQ